METLLDVFHLLRPWIGGFLCIGGALLALIGTVGVVRFPDFYTRLHASSVTDTAAAALLLTGMGVLAPHWLVAVKLFAIFIFLFLTTPTASHAIANAAHVAGLEPLIGRLATDKAAREALLREEAEAEAGEAEAVSPALAASGIPGEALK